MADQPQMHALARALRFSEVFEKHTCSHVRESEGSYLLQALKLLHSGL
jgi:hypothetical protein